MVSSTVDTAPIAANTKLRLTKYVKLGFDNFAFLAMRTTISANTARMKGEKKIITNSTNTDHSQTAKIDLFQVGNM